MLWKSLISDNQKEESRSCRRIGRGPAQTVINRSIPGPYGLFPYPPLVLWFWGSLQLPYFTRDIKLMTPHPADLSTQTFRLDISGAEGGIEHTSLGPNRALLPLSYLRNWRLRADSNPRSRLLRPMLDYSTLGSSYLRL